jgi:hypothetical protein
MAVILLLLYPLAPAIVVGTDIAHATVLSLVTGFAHLLNGNVDLPLSGRSSWAASPACSSGAGWRRGCRDARSRSSSPYARLRRLSPKCGGRDPLRAPPLPA